MNKSKPILSQYYGTDAGHLRPLLSHNIQNDSADVLPQTLYYASLQYRSDTGLGYSLTSYAPQAIGGHETCLRQSWTERAKTQGAPQPSGHRDGDPSAPRSWLWHTLYPRAASRYVNSDRPATSGEKSSKPHLWHLAAIRLLSSSLKSGLSRASFRLEKEA